MKLQSFAAKKKHIYNSKCYILDLLNPLRFATCFSCIETAETTLSAIWQYSLAKLPYDFGFENFDFWHHKQLFQALSNFYEFRQRLGAIF